MSCCVLNWQAVTTMLPAFLLAGAIALFVSSASVIRHLGAGAKQAYAYGVAAGSGFVLVLCSCNIVPLFNSIYRRGAGLGPAVAFLYAGPAINLVTTIFTLKVIGLGIGLYRAAVVPLIAIGAGLIVHFIYRKEEQERATQLAELRMAQEERHSPKQMAAFLGVLMLVLIVGATTVPKAIYLPNGWAIEHISEWGLRFGGIAVLLIPLVWMAKRWLSREDLLTWGKETWTIGKTVVPILVPAVLFIAFLATQIPIAPMKKWFSNDGLVATLSASLFGSLMYFPVLTEVAFTKAFLKVFQIGIGPAVALLLTGPGLSLPGMLLIHRYIGVKKVVVYWLVMVILSTAVAYLFGNVVGPYVCSCKLFKTTTGAAVPHEIDLWGQIRILKVGREYLHSEQGGLRR